MEVKGFFLSRVKVFFTMRSWPSRSAENGAWEVKHGGLGGEKVSGLLQGMRITRGQLTKPELMEGCESAPK